MTLEEIRQAANRIAWLTTVILVKSVIVGNWAKKEVEA